MSSHRDDVKTGRRQKTTLLALYTTLLCKSLVPLRAISLNLQKDESPIPTSEKEPKGNTDRSLHAPSPDLRPHLRIAPHPIPRRPSPTPPSPDSCYQSRSQIRSRYSIPKLVLQLSLPVRIPN